MFQESKIEINEDLGSVYACTILELLMFVNFWYYNIFILLFIHVLNYLSIIYFQILKKKNVG